MGKISVLELAKVLVEKKGLSIEAAELLVATMFDVIQEGLDRDKSVKIKGLGTFKIIDVEARQSVNVNTGERVVIESHGKVTFTPDATMKELVNKPFSQFETVLLNAGVEFDDLEEAANRESMVEQFMDGIATDDSVTEENTMLSAETDEKTEQSELDSETAEPDPEAADEEPETPFEKSETPFEEQETTDTVEQVEDEEPVTDEPKIKETKEEVVAEDIHETVETVVETVETPEEEQSAADEEEAENEEDEDGNEKSGKGKWIAFSLVSLLLILAAGYGGYWYGVKETQEHYEALINNVKVGVPNDSITCQKDTVVCDTVAVQKEQTDSITKTISDTIAVEKPKTEEVALDKYEQMDERVRTGAYRIVGTDYTVVIRTGETMKRLCKRTLGPGMACYIEVYNDMVPGAELEAGKRINIPKLEWKRKRKQ